jgi:aminoglycoside phosphotransferase (APT) family kinase protein
VKADHSTLAWIRRYLGPGAQLGPALVGGATSDVRLVEVGERRAVLKQIRNPAWLAERPDVVAYEARVLELVATTSIPVPRVLAVDESGIEAGHPSLLLSWIDGAPAGECANPDEWLDELVTLAVQIAAVDPPDWIRPFARYLEPEAAVPPVWAVDAGVWRRAIEIVGGAAPAAPLGFIHRDYHPWNVLWNGAVVGVVDWSQTSHGPVPTDVAHCRANLAIRFDAETAEDFKSRWETKTGWSHDPYWDLVTCVDFLPDWHPSARGNSRLEVWVRHLLASS